MLADLKRVERPLEGEYLHSGMSYKRLFFYSAVNPKTKVGTVVLFDIEKPRGKTDNGGKPIDYSRPSDHSQASVDVSASCYIWLVKPGSSKGQRNISVSQCETIFSMVLSKIQEEAGLESEYACISSSSSCRVSSLNFVELEDHAHSGVNEVISSLSKSNHGPTFVLMNSAKPSLQLKRYVPSFGSYPIIPLPFPPGPSHNPNLTTLPSLNWERPAIQLCLEAYLYMHVVSWPKRVSYARYGHIAVGNLGSDENVALYDITLSRLATQNRAVSWASRIPGRPDTGMAFLHTSDVATVPFFEETAPLPCQSEIWCDDDELISPAVRRPGCYRTVCVDIDVHDLAIAALSYSAVASSTLPTNNASNAHENGIGNSPTSVGLLDSRPRSIFAPLGDELATSVALALVRTLVGKWFHDAVAATNLTANELLHHVYRLVAQPEGLFHDSAIHRVIHSQMKSVFQRLLGELQRLGCDIVHATFHKITVATNKTTLTDAEEYIDFVLSTVRNRSSGNANEMDEALGRITLRKKQFHAHLVFLDEYNFGTLLLERQPKEEVREEEFVIIDEKPDIVVVPSVVTAWSMMNYLGNEVAQAYYRVIIGRFSKDVLKKHVVLSERNNSSSLSNFKDIEEQLRLYKRKMVSKHFASYLTRAVGEIQQHEADANTAPPFVRGRSCHINPALEFVKCVIVVLELDRDIEKEVYALKRSLLAQVGVAEYAKAAQWENPCPEFIVPDVFCLECYESRDVNVCFIPPPDEEDLGAQQWLCEECGTPYDVEELEQRLVDVVHRKMLRYQLQDARYRKTRRVVTKAIAKSTECSIGIDLDISREAATTELELLDKLADFHQLENLKQTTGSILRDFT